MINELWLRNFKAHEDSAVALARLNVLIGPNGAGKTSVLEAADRLSRCVSQRPSTVFRGAFDRFTIVRHAQRRFEIGVRGSFGGPKASVQLNVGTDKKPSTEPSSLDAAFTWTVTVGGIGTPVLADTPLRAEPADRKDLEGLGSAAFLRLNAVRLAESSYSDLETPQLGYDGYGLATLLNHLQSSEPERFGNVLSSLQAIIPSVRRVRTKRARVEIVESQTITIDGQRVENSRPKGVTGQALVFDTNAASSLPATSMSEGTLIVLGLLALLHGEQRPSLILLDDIDHALHPRAQADLIKELRKLLAQFPDLQILATSHSPYLVDHFEPSEVFLTATDANGVARIRRLDAHPELKRWHEEMSLGEFWSFAGEDWVRDHAEK